MDKNIKYARIQEEGGIIRPKNKKLLAWKTKSGKWAFAKQVEITPQPYLIPAYEKVKADLGGIIDAEITKTTK